MNISVSRKNMNEKLSWLKRSYERMKEKIDNPIEVQDHFWSFLHAYRLIWFYYAKWLDDNNRKGKAGIAVDAWKKGLSEQEANAWDLISSLRTEDVHVQPVEARNTAKPGNITLGGEPITIHGDPIVIGKWTYVANTDGKDYDILMLCENGIPVIQRFINEFDTL